MQYRREAFVVLLIFFSVFGSVSSDDSYVFVSTKQNEVRTIALAAQDNYANTCELVSTCLSPQNCSRLECYPIADQSSETTCVYVNDNKWCNNRTGAPCNNVEANFLKGYVRTPPLDFVSVGGTTAQDREIYLGSSICAQRNLDSTFINVNNTLRSNSSVNYFYNLYFGAADGSFRYYPGRELLSAVCGKYDPRIRPWYVGAISILKDLVILIDTGTAMEQSSNFLDPTTSFLEMTTSMIGQLVNTLTAGDRVTVLPVNASGSYTGLGNYQYTVPAANGALDPTAPDFQGLLSYINGSTFAGGGANGNGAPTNFTDGFVKANSTFGTSSPANSMQIVILITNSESNNSPHNGDRSAADGLKTLGSQLFVYDLSPGPTSWGTYACQDGENKAYLSINPLLFLSSYFSFLASARIAANGGAVPFWQNPYNDASDLGQVITVAYPAMSPDGQLIGVAGIDVQMAGLDSDPLLKSGVTQLLTVSPYHDITQNSNASNIGICQAAYKNNCSGITPGNTASLCNPLSPAASDKELTDLLCCKDCTGSSSSHVALWVSVGVLCGLFVLLIIAGIFLIARARRRKGPPGSLRAEFAINDYSYDVLKKATNGFATKNVIGKGSFGVVYKAVLGDETVAVKQLSQPADRAEDFEAEIRILGVTSHPNLVQLKGTCFQPTQCFLVYELVDSGDLHSWLWPVEKDHTATSTVGSDSECWSQRFLTWNKRRKIARGVARGLNYLHRGLQPKGTVFHLDIKPHNILLEYNFNPKIADFGISQLYEPGYTFKVASVVRGTFGYIAPEVLQGQVKPNSKLDVYSYGMVLLQLVSGRKINDPEVKPFLLQWARTHEEDGHVEKVVDENLIGTVQEEYREALMDNCKQLITLSLRCLADRPEVRPEMSEVLETIDSLKDVLDLETPATSENEEDRSGTPSNDKSTDLNLKKASRSPGGHLLPFSGEQDGSFERLSSESRDKVESMERNPEIAPSVSSPRVPGEKAAEGQDFLERESSNKGTSTQDGSGSLSRSSVDYSFEGDLGRPNMQIEPKSRTLRRSFSS
ncbi:unnamed protein product [Calypogeia fissa]